MHTWDPLYITLSIPGKGMAYANKLLADLAYEYPSKGRNGIGYPQPQV